MVQNGVLGHSFECDEVDKQSDGPELRLDFDAQSESRATSEQQDARADELTLAQFRSVDNILALRLRKFLFTEFL